MKMKLKWIVCGIFATTTLASASTPKVIAHQGYWKCDGSYGNTISALKNAIDLKVYGSEFDVRLTSDDILVVHHDAKTKQGTDIERSTYATVSKDLLPNGEKIPTLEEYFNLGKTQKKTKLILELKTSKVSAERQKIAVEKTVELVKKLKVKNLVEFIVFDNESGKNIIKLLPKAKVAYLNGDLTPEEVEKTGYTGIDYHIKVLRKHPEWIADCQKRKMTVNVWTVDKENDMTFFIEKGVDYITTNEPVILTKKLK